MNSLLEDLGKETPDEEIDEVMADESEEEDEEETTYDIAQRITLKINELKKVFQNNENILNHKHSDLGKTDIQVCLKLIRKDYEKPLKTLTSQKYKYEHNVILQLHHLESKVDKETKDMLANVEHSKLSQITHTMRTTEPPAWLWSFSEEGEEYWTEVSPLSGEQNLYRLTMNHTLMRVGSYKRIKDEDGFKVRVMTFLDTPVEAVEPTPEPTPESTPEPTPEPDACPFNENQIIVNYTYENDYERFVNAKKLGFEPDSAQKWKHIVHGVDAGDKKTTLCRLVIAKYSRGVESPTTDDISYEIHYYRCEKKGKKKHLWLDENTKLNWEPSKHMWPEMLATHGLKTRGDITIYGCRVD